MERVRVGTAGPPSCFVRNLTNLYVSGLAVSARTLGVIGLAKVIELRYRSRHPAREHRAVVSPDEGQWGRTCVPVVSSQSARDLSRLEVIIRA